MSNNEKDCQKLKKQGYIEGQEFSYGDNSFGDNSFLLWIIKEFYKNPIVSRSLKKEAEENEILIHEAVHIELGQMNATEIEINGEPLVIEVIAGPNGRGCYCCEYSTLWYRKKMN